MDASELETLLTEFAEKLKEPASEDLERCVVEQMEADGDVDDFVRRGIDDIASKYAQLGAQWQKEQFEKNRLAHCDAQTEVEAEVESDFVMGIIGNEHRQPTFDDAIKYGMRLQREQMQLTHKDIQRILDIADKLAMDYGSEKLNEIGYDDYCKEVLDRYVKQSGKP